MKQLVISVCVFFFLALTVHANGIKQDVEFTGDKSRSSYALGMTVGGDLQQAGLEIDYAAFLEGLKAGMDEKPAIMDREDALEIVQDALERAVRMQSAVARAQEEAFLAENAAQSGVIQTESGLQYMVLEEGNGPKPGENDTVRVHYEGMLVDGTIFDSSYERGETEDIPLDMVISGWAEGILLMNVGSKHRIYLPSYLAYGERGAGQIIPPFATLIFTIELFEIVTGEENLSATDTESSTGVSPAELSADSDSED